MLTEPLGRVVHEAPGDLQEEKPDGQLHSADERAREGAAGEVDQAEAAGNKEDETHQERSRGNLVLTQALRDRDRPERLQRLYRNRQSVGERDRQ